MAGLNPDGLGRNRSFDDTESDSVKTDETDTDELAADIVRGAVGFSSRLSFRAEKQHSLFTDGNYYDPEIFHKRHFDDDEYRLVVAYTADNNYELYRTPDFSEGSLTMVQQDILPGLAAGSGNSVQDHVNLPNGDFALYLSINDASTEIYTGTSLTDLSRLGEVLADRSDVGTYLHTPKNTVHIYPEDPNEAQFGVDSNVLEHWTTPVDNLLTSTQQSDALDVSGKDWATGDADIIKAGNYYYMFLDNHTDTYDYRTALARSTDLYNWTLTHEQIKNSAGGDLVVSQHGGEFAGVTEYSNAISYWRVIPYIDDGRIEEPGVGGINRFHTVEEFPSNSRTGYEVDDWYGNELLTLFAGFGDAWLESQNDINITREGSGQSELIVSQDEVIEHLPEGFTVVPQSTKPSNPPSGRVKKVLADGTNWDPDGDGNAEYGLLLPDGSFVETTDLGTTL